MIKEAGLEKLNIAVALPCYNEEATITKVIGDFKKVLPDAAIHVFDNNSTDNSNELAKKAGATIHFVEKRGKGNVMRSIFDEIDAEILLVADSDDTYSAEDAPMLIRKLIEKEADMVVGNRLHAADGKSMRKLHQVGNRIIIRTINMMFGTKFEDILSGYRIFNENFIKNIPLLSAGFDTETELTLQALENGMRIIEVPVSYKSRPDGSVSKLRSFSDGYKIISNAILILRDKWPSRFFGMISTIFMIITLIAAAFRVANYTLHADFMNALFTGLILLSLPISIFAFGIGVILNAISVRFQELNQILKRKDQNGR
jgi:glycosyltransferase involved in cell wall biosynthesis